MRQKRVLLGILKSERLVDVVYGWSQRDEKQFLNAWMAPNEVKTPCQSMVKNGMK